MSIFPQVIEDIIFNYKNQMEHKEKFQSTVQAINKINYITGTFNDGELYLTTRELPAESYMRMIHVEYYHQPYSQRKNRLMIEQHYFRYDTVIHSMSIETTVDGFVKIKDLGIAYD